MNILFPPAEKGPEDPTRILGKRGESVAARFLQKAGMRIVAANFRVPIGRNRKGVAVNAEIDLIALDETTLCFIEVKTRSADDGFAPEAAVDLRKQRQIIRAAKKYRRIFRLENTAFRYDVVSVLLLPKTAPRTEHYKSYWNEEKFRKNSWSDDDYSAI